MPVPWPGLIATEGVLRANGAVNPGELDRFVQTSMDECLLLTCFC